ncbi:MAG: hypothetical protein ACX94D_05860 [Henriciella sp.]|jgi:hypothetical protein
MLALQLLAITFLALSAAFMFGPALVMYGPRAMPTLMRDGQARFVGGFLGSAALLALLLPGFGTAMSSGGGAITLVMTDLVTMRFNIA